MNLAVRPPSSPPCFGPLAAAGFGVLAGGLLLAGGLGLYDATKEVGFLYASFAVWALADLFVTPLMALVFQGEPTRGPPPSPLTFRF